MTALRRHFQRAQRPGPRSVGLGFSLPSALGITRWFASPKVVAPYWEPGKAGGSQAVVAARDSGEAMLGSLSLSGGSDTLDTLMTERLSE
jgi:hypothetical protein